MKSILKANLILAVVFSLLFVSCSQENVDSDSPQTVSGKKSTSLSANVSFGNVVQLSLSPDLITTKPQNLVWCSDYLYDSPIDSIEFSDTEYGYIYYSIDTINNRLGEVYIYAPFYNQVKSIYPDFANYLTTNSSEAIKAIEATNGWRDNVDNQNPGEIPVLKTVPLCSEISAWARFWGKKCATGERVPMPDNSELCQPEVESGFIIRRRKGAGVISPC